MAGQLLAGLDGIQRKIDPGVLGYGPIDANIFAWSDEQRLTIQKLPSSMREAMLALQDDHDFLLAGEVFSPELIQQWINYKLEMEYYQVRNRPHPYEVSLYFDV